MQLSWKADSVWLLCCHLGTGAWSWWMLAQAAWSRGSAAFESYTQLERQEFQVAWLQLRWVWLRFKPILTFLCHKKEVEPVPSNPIKKENTTCRPGVLSKGKKKKTSMYEKAFVLKSCQSLFCSTKGEKSDEKSMHFRLRRPLEF